jgi:hypothetical protein
MVEKLISIKKTKSKEKGVLERARYSLIIVVMSY